MNLAAVGTAAHDWFNPLLALLLNPLTISEQATTSLYFVGGFPKIMHLDISVSLSAFRRLATG